VQFRRWLGDAPNVAPEQGLRSRLRRYRTALTCCSPNSTVDTAGVAGRLRGL